jgi:cation diffusion facilitator CzcD-associated flavoprotein CzcO
MTERVGTVIIGGGQAGLSTSYHLTRRDRKHILPEKNRVGESWKSKKWDSFTLVTPNWQKNALSPTPMCRVKMVVIPSTCTSSQGWRHSVGSLTRGQSKRNLVGG